MTTDRAAHTRQAIADELQAVDASFREWLGKDEVKMLLSQIPDTGQRDILLGLLRAAYKAGSSRGQAALGIALLQDIVERRIEENRQ